jgi:hypothetical protein
MSKIDMNRKDLVRAAVLLDISDDYENTEHIVHSQWLSSVAETCRATFDPHEVTDALSELIQTGLAKAYRLSPYAPAEEIAGVPSSDQFDDYYIYFYITEEGKVEIHRMREMAWPFDDEGAFRPEFRAWVNEG